MADNRGNGGAVGFWLTDLLQYAKVAPHDNSAIPRGGAGRKNKDNCYGAGQ
ncbi:hypothetical protein VAWG002_02140 [Aeromonas veronii]|nr:hypothetical protein VAWG002_02140 [Aeromonas veronii]